MRTYQYTYDCVKFTRPPKIELPPPLPTCSKNVCPTDASTSLDYYDSLCEFFPDASYGMGLLLDAATV